MADPTYAPKVYQKQGSDEVVVASGGKITVESGGLIVFESGGKFDNAGALAAASFTVGGEAANAINVAIQLKDAQGNDLAVHSSVFAYLSDDANGNSIVATAPDGGWAIGTDGLLIPVVTSKAAHLTSEADGDIDVTITHAAGAKTCYLIVVLPNGKLTASGAITFAA